MQPSQQKNMAFMGSVVSSGLGSGIVVATGARTEFGRTANVLSAKEPATDFQTNINKFGKFLIKVIFLLTIFVFASNALLGKDPLMSFLFALALAVGITPELLPIIITISLSSGALHLAKKKVIIKRLVAIEDLGNMDVLCTDKTGTLTENMITLEDYSDPSGRKSEKVLEYSLLCNSAILEKGKAEGNVIDVAIWNHSDAKKAPLSQYKKVEEVEFDFVRRRMGFVVSKAGRRIYICKGAPESVLGVCDYVGEGGRRTLIGPRRKELEKKFQELSARGFRVVAVASKEIGVKKEYTEADEKGLTLDGFLSFLDPPKATAVHALKSFKALGVEVKLLTGDNELVAAEVCKEVGLESCGRVVLGSELEKMAEGQFAKAVSENGIFARVTPEQKFRIVQSLTKQGHIVGFLGDGVNDAPALKAADVGITVDSAVDVAKDSADIILLQKGLMVIAEGIREGRKTFGNITKYILNTISANFGNMFSMTISSVWLPFIPLLPSQILLNNLISDGPLTTVSTDNVDEDYLHKPRKWNIRAISHFMVFFGLISTIFDLATMAIMWFMFAGNAALFRTAWFLESVLSEIVITFAIRTRRSFWKSRPSRMLLYSSIIGVILSAAIIYPPFGGLFDFRALDAQALAAIAGILIAYFALAEASKKIFYRKYEL
jgi:Mg2+-importing ATPase